ncbi:hypothetical protein P7K49_003962 [Saguinus oedipus]|uniref:Uncharacterized protein n=1 Tax=Saguinus oedipus TaxID=9490 RepID=A0ABQ9W609_SAGOE|nr:hypothetical protein P7K49_003962 [Saguinus oedipus]
MNLASQSGEAGAGQLLFANFNQDNTWGRGEAGRGERSRSFGLPASPGAGPGRAGRGALQGDPRVLPCSCGLGAGEVVERRLLSPSCGEAPWLYT